MAENIMEKYRKQKHQVEIVDTFKILEMEFYSQITIVFSNYVHRLL